MTDLAAWLKATRELCEKATPGPWKFSEMSPLCDGHYHWAQVCVAEGSLTIAETDDSAPPFVARIHPDLNDTESHIDDGQFIASARAALPRALDIIEEQQKRITELEESRDAMADRHWLNGLQAGWNYGQMDDVEGFRLSVRSRQNAKPAAR